MTKEFMDNDQAADTKYKDKYVEVSGAIWIVNDEKTITLIGVKKDAKDVLGISIVCDFLPSEADRVKKLAKDMNVKVVGRNVRSVAGITLQLSDCKLVEPAAGKAALPNKDAFAGVDTRKQGLITGFSG